MKHLPRKPPRYAQDNSPYFLTFCTFKRRPLLHFSGVPEMLVDNLHFYEHKIDKVVAYSIMPDHLHLLVEVKEIKTLTAFLRDFKKYTAKEILQMLIHHTIEFSTHALGLRRSVDQPLQVDRIWQPGTMDHCIRMTWDGKDYENHLSYLFFNSKKHLDIAPKDFPWHNFMEFVEQGVFDQSFFAVDDKVVKKCAIYEK
ncbi:MAG: transposase [Ignavibacteriae bacterium]|nr:transposase [Ignavibacteria bacterium]MBI3363696.1 transposase [Ignavibacteriota bacterium]